MQRKQETREIDGVRFEVTALGGEQALEVFHRLGTMIAPALAGFAELGDMAGLERLLSGSKLSDLQWLAEIFGKHTRVSSDGDRWPYLDKGQRDILFSGRITLLFQWLKFCCEVNFPDFLEYAKRAMSGRDRGAKMKVESPNQS